MFEFRYDTLITEPKQETNYPANQNFAMDFSLDKALKIAEQSALEAGQILRDMLLTATVREKSPKDLVTDADIAAQEAIENRLLQAFPSHQFLGEESDLDYSTFAASDAWLWVVDPLDGTANYVHRLPNFAVSIALVHRSEIYLGVVYDPMANEMFTAIRGEGAAMNGQPMRTSGCSKIGEAMVAASFPPQVNRHSPEVGQFLRILELSQSVRRLGSAALNLCYVGLGRLDAYWANRLKPWDLAGGVLIAAESGAKTTGLARKSLDIWKGEILVSATPELHLAMENALQSDDSD